MGRSDSVCHPELPEKLAGPRKRANHMGHDTASWLRPPSRLHLDLLAALCLIRKRLCAGRMKNLLLAVCVAMVSSHAMQGWLIRAIDRYCPLASLDRPAESRKQIDSSRRAEPQQTRTEKKMSLQRVAYLNQFCLSFKQAYNKNRRIRAALEHHALAQQRMPRLPSIDECISEQTGCTSNT